MNEKTGITQLKTFLVSRRKEFKEKMLIGSCSARAAFKTIREKRSSLPERGGAGSVN